ncbi:hypothetical protein [Streptomyces fungicidicus]|uniref:hypothetical protein n=1 Tax=Streptomyces fungicidicus TaxID=68203 RepID=UPI0033FE38A3
MTMDLSDEGDPLAPEWTALDNNLAGILPGHRDASYAAERFVRAGWRSTSSSWHGYEVGTRWCELNLDPTDDHCVLLNGVIAPDHLTTLAALLDRFELPYSLELYDETGTLTREIRSDTGQPR